ncbi:MAG: redoxin domain-containing protein [Anaerolineaceae bacterium]
MDGNTPEIASKNLTRMIIVGILIGFGLALVLFGLQTLITSSRASREVQPTGQALTIFTALPRATPRQQVVEQFIPGTATPTTVLLQFDQMWAAVGEPAPYFTLTTLDGLNVSLEELKGRPVILNFWASWCEPCSMEMPGLQKNYEKYKDTGLIILGINAIEKDDLAKVTEFVSEHNLTFPILLDTNSSTSSAIYGVNGLPTSYFIDADGFLRRIQIGAMLPEVIEKYTLEILPDEE